MNIYRLSRQQFNDPLWKNKCIAGGNDPWIFFALEENEEITRLASRLSETDTCPVTVFCCTNPSDSGTEPLSSTQSLLRFDEDITAILVKRSIFIKTGCFNELLGAGSNLEFVCRAADEGGALWVEIGQSKSSDQIRNDTYDTDADMADITKAVAFMCCKYRLDETKTSLMEPLLERLTDKMKQLGILKEFMAYLGDFVRDQQFFQNCLKNTAPVYIITGDDTAYGMLRDFAASLAASLVKHGQAVITTDGKYAPYHGVKDIEDRPLKALVGFQAPALFKEFFRFFQAPIFEFWFDDPVFFDHLFDSISGSDMYHILCQDGFHAEHFRKHYGLKNAMHFPPGWPFDGKEPDFENRDLEVVFIGTWRKAEKPEGMDEFAEAYCKHMLTNPQLTYEQGVEEVLGQRGIELSHDKYMELLWSLAPVYRYIRAVYRNGVIDALLAAGIRINVYGESWNEYEPTMMPENSGRSLERADLIRHAQLSPKEVTGVLKRAKISLNIMSWHKDGMTERIIGSMLCGAVCVSDKTVYLENHFSDKEMLLFDLSCDCDKEEGPASLIRSLLSDEKKRIQMSRAAYNATVSLHTWDKRAEQLLELIYEIA